MHVKTCGPLHTVSGSVQLHQTNRCDRSQGRAKCMECFELNKWLYYLEEECDMKLCQILGKSA
jgi:hypothetical protein